MFRKSASDKNRDLSWLDLSVLDALSPDGNTVLFDEGGQASGSELGDIFLRKTDGAPAVRLASKASRGVFSPNQKWILTFTQVGSGQAAREQLVYFPTGVGERKFLEPYGIVRYIGLSWSPDARQVVFAGSASGHEWRVYAQPLDGSKPRPITGEISRPGEGEIDLISPDGKVVWGRDTDRQFRLYPMDGSLPRLIPGITSEDAWINWGPDSRTGYIFRPNELPAKVFRIDLVTGHKTLIAALTPDDTIGVHGVDAIKTSPDGKAFAYSYTRALSELHLVSGLK